MAKIDFLFDSLAAAISQGRRWEPSFHFDYLEESARHHHDSKIADLTSGVRESQSSWLHQYDKATANSANRQQSGRLTIPAETVRDVLRCCENDDMRFDCDPEDGLACSSATLGKQGQDCGPILVTRFGVEIASVTIEGYLNLSGFRFDRPLSFRDCEFSHTLNLANARLGPLSMETCKFLPINSSRLTPAKLLMSYDEQAKKSVGHLPHLMKFAPGVNAFGAHFKGDVYIDALTASRLDFQMAHVEGVLDLNGVSIELPEPDHFSKWQGQLGENSGEARIITATESRLARDLIALDLTGVRAKALNMAPTATEGPTCIDGALCVRNATFGTIDIRGCLIAGKVVSNRFSEELEGSRWRSILGTGLTVEGDFDLSSVLSDRSERYDASQSILHGQVRLEGVTVRGSFRIEGTKFFTGLASNVINQFGHKEHGEPNPDDEDRESQHKHELREAARAVVLRGAKIGGSFWLKGVKSASDRAPLGRLVANRLLSTLGWHRAVAALRNIFGRLRQAKPDVGDLPSKPQLRALERRILGAIAHRPLDSFEARFLYADGEIDLRNSEIGGDLRIQDCCLTNLLRSTAIDLRNTVVKSTLSFRKLHPFSIGNIDLRDAYAEVYRDDFDNLYDQYVFQVWRGFWRSCKRLVRDRLLNPFGLSIITLLVVAVGAFCGSYSILYLKAARSIESIALGSLENFVLSQMRLMKFFDEKVGVLAPFESEIEKLVLTFVISVALVLLLFQSFPVVYRFARSHNGKRLARERFDSRIRWLPTSLLLTKSSKSGWPSELRFLLSGFKYVSFPVRTARKKSKDRSDSDDSEMPIDDGARVRWLKQQPARWIMKEFQPQPFVQCARTLRDMGYFDQARRTLFFREHLALRSREVGAPEQFVRRVLLIMCGHGHAMHRVVYLAAAIYGIGVVNNDIAKNANLVRPTNAEILVSKKYLKEGFVPVDYSSFRPGAYTFGQMLLLPPLAGRGEWAACNQDQIQTAYSLHEPDAPYKGACLPRTCGVSEPVWRAGGVEVCEELPMRFAVVDSFDRIMPTWTVLSETRSAANFAERLNDGKDQTGTKLTEILDEAYSNGIAPRINLFVVVVGWMISILVGTFALGLLKRRE